jgi:hypothetical protein
MVVVVVMVMVVANNGGGDGGVGGGVWWCLCVVGVVTMVAVTHPLAGSACSFTRSVHSHHFHPLAGHFTRTCDSSNQER